MNKEHQQQCQHFDSELHKEVVAIRESNEKQYEILTQNYGALRSDVMALKETLFGNEHTQDIGMKAKLDEMYVIVTQLKGLKWILASIMLIVGTIVTVKSLFK